MNGKGWGWSPSEIRRARLIEWLAQQPAGNRVTAAEFYNGLEDQSLNTSDVVLSDLEALEGQSLITRFPGLAGIPDQQIKLTQALYDWAGELCAKRESRGLRRAQCRDALVAWLYAADAVNPLEAPAMQAILEDPRYGIWYAEPFPEEDLDAAAAWLHDKGMVKGPTVDAFDGPVKLYLTDAGLRCGEEFGADTGRYVQARHGPSYGPTVNIQGSNSGPFQLAGDHAHQEQRIGASADQLRTMITSIAELVSAVVPGADVAGQKEAALAAARDGAVDRTVLQRFADWAVSVVNRGATAALVPAVSAATTEMMLEAGRLTGHL